MDEGDYPQIVQSRRLGADVILLWLSYALMVGALVSLVVFDVGVYQRFLETGMLGTLAFAIGMPALAYYALKTKNELLQAWAAFGALLLLLLGVAAIGDAAQYQGHNCWAINSAERGGETRQVLECAPGSEPQQGSTFNRYSETGSYRYCDYLRRTSSGGTIWRCESGDI